MPQKCFKFLIVSFLAAVIDAQICLFSTIHRNGPESIEDAAKLDAAHSDCATCWDVVKFCLHGIT